MNQRVAGSIPRQGTCLGCGLGPQWGALQRQPHIDVSLPLCLSPFPSLKINKIFKKKNPVLQINSIKNIFNSPTFLHPCLGLLNSCFRPMNSKPGYPIMMSSHLLDLIGLAITPRYNIRSSLSSGNCSTNPGG